MPKFNIGDTVIGNDSTRYAITKKGWIGVVIDPNQSKLITYGYYFSPENGDIVVAGPYGEEFIVDEYYFDLYKAAVPVDVTEFLSLMFESSNCT